MNDHSRNAKKTNYQYTRGRIQANVRYSPAETLPYNEDKEQKGGSKEQRKEEEEKKGEEEVAVRQEDTTKTQIRQTFKRPAFKE